MSTPLPDGAVYLWRCRCCGKWSHARRKPGHHVRVVVDPPGYLRIDPETVISTDPGYTSEHDSIPPTITVRCGPFETFLAIPCEPT